MPAFRPARCQHSRSARGGSDGPGTARCNWPVHGPSMRRLTGSGCRRVRAAVTAGIDHIDTAQYYGRNVVNDLIREALYPYPGELAIVSKVGASGTRGAAVPHDDARQLREGIEGNLRSLRVDQLAAVNLRLPSPGRADARFDDQLAAMVQARDEGLIAGVGLSNVSLEQSGTPRTAPSRLRAEPVPPRRPRLNPSLVECTRRGIAFVPFCPLGLPRGAADPVSPTGGHPDGRPPQRHPAAGRAAVAAAGALSVLLIPGTGSTVHLMENLAADRWRWTTRPCATWPTSARDPGGNAASWLTASGPSTGPEDYRDARPCLVEPVTGPI